MPASIALLICILIIAYLFWIDRENSNGVSSALWLPFFWCALSASRTVSQWLSFQTPDLTEDPALAGNALDRVVFSALIIAGVFVLSRRKTKLGALLLDNKSVWLYFVFGAISLAWSDFPFVGLKRLIKAMGTVVMALIVATEQFPVIALAAILRRLSFALLPLSVLFIKYYPELGRAYHMGKQMYTGVGFQKNSLGAICLITGIYFAWNIIFGVSRRDGVPALLPYSVYLLIIPMILWLLYMANSATSLLCLVLAVALFVISRIKLFRSNPQLIIPLGLTGLMLFFMLDGLFDFKATVIAMLGRSQDLTGRTDIWNVYLSLVRDPVIGYGFESVYISARSKDALEMSGSTHNGYLEMYLNLGVVGLFFVVAWVISGLTKIYKNLLVYYEQGILRLSLLVVVLLYSWSESTFAGVSIMWFLLFFAIINKPCN